MVAIRLLVTSAITAERDDSIENATIIAWPIPL